MRPRKYSRLFPYIEVCDNKHIFEKFGNQEKCLRCNWIKHIEEIEGERELSKRIERMKSRVEIKTKHISLFHF